MQASQSIDFTVKTTGVEAFWIAVDHDDVPVTNGKGEKTLEAGTHVVAWWMQGNAGGSLAIEGADARDNVVVKFVVLLVPADR